MEKQTSSQDVAMVAGIAAARAGVLQDANPYPPRTWERTCWAEGWSFAPELHSGAEDDESCIACGMHCWEQGGCDMLREHGGMDQLRAVREGHEPSPDVWSRFKAEVEGADLRRLVRNRRDTIARWKEAAQ